MGAVFYENLAFIWPFSPFENLAFFENACGQIWPFLFSGTWQSCAVGPLSPFPTFPK
jgi:hypothetical protein